MFMVCEKGSSRELELHMTSRDAARYLALRSWMHAILQSAKELVTSICISKTTSVPH